VAAEMLPNTIGAYKVLSRVTAEARRNDGFPALIDRTRAIHVDVSFSGPSDARAWLRELYRRDRTEGQSVSLYLGVEKHGLVEQLRAWFSDYGIPVVSLGGYASQTYADEVREHVERQGRSAVLIYAGDLDASGEDIDRDFVKRGDCFDEVVRIALTPEQVTQHNLPPQPGKATDSRAAGFRARHGRLMQVELDALPPEVLRGLYQEAIDRYWDMSTFAAVRAQEDTERMRLR
jgi:hypothetical protein